MKNDFFQVSNFFNPFIFSDAKILSNDEKYIICLHAPQLDAGSLSISIKDHILTIESTEHEEFYMRFMLPTDVIEEDISAAYENETIQVTIPRVSYEYSSI